MKKIKEKTQAEKDFENSPEFRKFEKAMKQLMNISPERLEEIKKAVPYPKEERTEEEYNEKISLYLPDDEEDDSLFLMANLLPADTGLPMVIWFSEKGNENEMCNIKVQTAHGKKIKPFDWISIVVTDEPQALEDTLDSKDFTLVKKYISQNKEAIVKYWNHETSTAELLHSLVKIKN